MIEARIIPISFAGRTQYAVMIGNEIVRSFDFMSEAQMWAIRMGLKVEE